MKSFFNKIKQKNTSSEIDKVDQDLEGIDVDVDVDHLWMSEDEEAEKQKLVKDPRIDTGILRNRIAEKLAKT